jgi:pyrroloquinoline quinone (PQQ) biosynthesis protein C
MPSKYKQSRVVVMDSGKIVLWTGYAEDQKHAEGLAIAYAIEKHGGQVWDSAVRPVISKGSK